MLLGAHPRCFHHPRDPATPSGEKFPASLSQTIHKFPDWLPATSAAVFKGIVSPLSPCGTLMHVFLASHLLYSAEGEGALLDPVASPSLESLHVILTAEHLSGAIVAELTRPHPCYGTWLQSILRLSKPCNRVNTCCMKILVPRIYKGLRIAIMDFSGYICIHTHYGM